MSKGKKLEWCVSKLALIKTLWNYGMKCTSGLSNESGASTRSTERRGNREERRARYTLTHFTHFPPICLLPVYICLSHALGLSVKIQGPICSLITGPITFYADATVWGSRHFFTAVCLLVYKPIVISPAPERERGWWNGNVWPVRR